jgi:hypothetical protein
VRYFLGAGVVTAGVAGAAGVAAAGVAGVEAAGVAGATAAGSVVVVVVVALGSFAAGSLPPHATALITRVIAPRIMIVFMLFLLGASGCSRSDTEGNSPSFRDSSINHDRG